MASRFECESCGYIFKQQTEFCPYCGNPNVNYEKPEEPVSTDEEPIVIKKTYFSEYSNETSAGKNKMTVGQLVIIIVLLFSCTPIGLVYLVVVSSKNNAKNG